MIVNFYATSQDNLVKVLATLLQKIRMQNEKAIVLATDQTEAEYFDNYLWAQGGWLPHTIKHTEHEKNAQIVISFDENTNDFVDDLFNKVQYVFVLNRALLLKSNSIQKVFIIFDQHNEEILLFNRKRWKEYKSLNWELNFYNQEKNGKFTQMLI